MQSSALDRHRQLFPSLVGIAPLFDVMEDLPLPRALPTDAEKSVLGTRGISSETRRLLNTSDPTVASKITEALLSVNCSFLDLKEPPQTVPMSPSLKPPPLIQSVMFNVKPVVQLEKLDPKSLTGSVSTSNLSPHKSHRPPGSIGWTQENEFPPGTNLKKKAPKPRARQISSSSGSDKAVHSVKRKHKPTKSKRGKLIVSIPRSFHKRTTPLKDFTVRVPRSRLPPHATLDYHGGESGFTMVEGQGQTVPLEYPKHHKKKRRHHHHLKHDSERGQKLAKFIRILDSTVDLCITDELLTNLAVSRLVSEVFSLKKQGLLHEVPVDRLVGLLQTMDTHVLDSAQLQLHLPPDGVEHDPRGWKEHARDRVLRSCDAAIIILHVATTPGMPKNVLVEESIEQIITLTKYHLENNIYPQFDFVYRMEYKDSAVLPSKKRRSGVQAVDKDTTAIYHKLTEVLGNIAMLVELHPLTDSTVLTLSGLGIVPFFVENVNILQLSALRLVRAIFSRYEKHRDLIIEEIFASLAKLPTSKRNLRPFKLSNGQSIQMLTALVLQLVQCIVTPRENSSSSEGADQKDDEIDFQMTKGYDLALSVGNRFLAKFQKKCCSGKDEDDYRPLFENFVHDLLATLNLPEWPSSEVLLTLLAMLLVRSFSSKSNEQSLRLTSIDHLGVIAARLRGDVVASNEADQQEQIEILAQVLQCQADRRTPSPTELRKMDAFTENMQHFQKVLIAYLNKKSGGDPAYAYARDFYIAQWIYDTQVELEKVLKDPSFSNVDDFDPLEPHMEIRSSDVALQQSEMKSDMLRSLLDPKRRSSLKSLENVLDDRKAATVTRSLASCRALSKSFDAYLQNLIRMVNDSAVHVRTKAMKALSTIVTVDPEILSRSEMQRVVEFRFTDQSTLVREATVEFVGRFILNRPELTLQYYSMLSQRIRDSGVSVRKRVIKILKDICVLQPDFPKVNEICMIILRRVQIDEESVKQMVVGVFRELWFTPPPPGSDETEAILRRVNNITAVVGLWKESDWFEQLLKPMLKSEDKAAVETVLSVCQKMVDCLVQKVLAQDESSTGKEKDLVSCVTSLHMFCNIKPALLLNHVTTLHPYLSSSADVVVPHYMAKIFKDVVPLMDRPNPSFLATLEGNLVKIIMNYGQLLILSSVECLGAIVNKVTHNYNLVNDCYLRFTNCMQSMRVMYAKQPSDPRIKSHRGSLLRSVYTVGVMCKHFNMDSIPLKEGTTRPTAEEIYSNLFFFVNNGDKELQIKAVRGFGLFTIRYPEMMLKEEAKKLYHDWLSRDSEPMKKIQVLRNILYYLKEVETKLQMADSQLSSEADKTDLLEFGDQHSSVSSSIAQTFLNSILEALLHIDTQVRNAALMVIVQIMHQGLVHPNQCVPFLIVMSTDSEATIKGQADKELSEHTQRYGHLMQTQLTKGVKKSYEFQQIIAGEVPRGYSADNVGTQLGLLNHVYTLVRSNKQHRRAFLRSLLRYFEDYEKSSVGFLLYLADNLACLPYNTLEEPLFVVHHIDLTVSVTGSNLLQQFREALGTSTAHLDDEDLYTLSQQQCDLRQLADCCHSCQGCVLLLLLKQHLKKCYSLSDSKCQKYSPTEPSKTYDKAISRRSGVEFNPAQVLEQVKREFLGQKQALLSLEQYLREYTEFKELMNKLDPFDEDGSDQEIKPAIPEQQERQVDYRVAPVKNDVVEELQRPRSRRSSVSSVASTSSHKSQGRRASTTERKSKPKKKRKIMISSDESDGDPDYT